MHVGLFGRDGTTLYHDGAGSFISDSACRNSCNDTAKISNFAIICFTSISLTLGKIHIQYHTILKKIYIFMYLERYTWIFQKNPNICYLCLVELLMIFYVSLFFLSSVSFFALSRY